MTLKLESTAFLEGDPIPRVYTCDGEDISPPLSWTPGPAGTKTFALICDDPDSSKTWSHWVLFDVPAAVTDLPEAIPTRDHTPEGGTQGTNDFRKIGYGGPCPPSGNHRYFFKLYALDAQLKLPSTATQADVERAMKGHVLAEAALMGRYSRS